MSAVAELLVRLGFDIDSATDFNTGDLVFATEDKAFELRVRYEKLQAMGFQRERELT